MPKFVQSLPWLTHKEDILTFEAVGLSILERVRMHAGDTDVVDDLYAVVGAMHSVIMGEKNAFTSMSENGYYNTPVAFKKASEELGYFLALESLVDTYEVLVNGLDANKASGELDAYAIEDARRLWVKICNLHALMVPLH